GSRILSAEDEPAEGFERLRDGQEAGVAHCEARADLAQVAAAEEAIDPRENDVPDVVPLAERRRGQAAVGRAELGEQAEPERRQVEVDEVEIAEAERDVGREVQREVADSI